jgi:hypothetical protein
MFTGTGTSGGSFGNSGSGIFGMAPSPFAALFNP